MPVSEDMKTHLQGNTNLAVFVKITARDGEVLRVWNGTRNKILSGETYLAYPISPSQLQTSNGLKADNLEVSAVYSGLWNSATLRANKWLNARVEYAVYDYKDFTLGFAERRIGFIGQTEVGRFAAKPELKSLAQKLSEARGMTYLEDCSVVEFGDLRCGVDLDGVTQNGYKIQTRAHVAAPVLNRQQFTIEFDEDIKPSDSGVLTAPNNLFERGKIEILSGANLSSVTQILVNTGNALTLYLPLPYSVTVGTQIRLTTGCNRKIATCRDIYANAERNRSFFMLPGRNKILKFPE